MDKSIILKLSRHCEELSEVVEEMHEQHLNLVEYSKNETFKRFAMESLLVDKGILSTEELDERFRLILEEINK